VGFLAAANPSCVDASENFLSVCFVLLFFFSLPLEMWPNTEPVGMTFEFGVRYDGLYIARGACSGNPPTLAMLCAGL
jgi:hypothetical protein